MKAFRRFFTRIWNFSAGRQYADRLREEMDDHIDMQTDENLRAGMELTGSAPAGIGEVGRRGRRSRKAIPGRKRFARTGKHATQDLRFSARMLRKSPVFTTVAVLTLALGIGANAAIFTLMNTFMLKRLPVTDPKSLVRLGNNNDCCVGYSASDAGEFSPLLDQRVRVPAKRTRRNFRNSRPCRQASHTAPSWHDKMELTTPHVP